MMPKRNRRLPNKEKYSQSSRTDSAGDKEKRVKQKWLKREAVESYFLDMLNNSSAEVKKTFKELKKYPMIVRAVYLGHEGAVDTLIEIGDSVNVQIADGSSPLIMAAERGHSHLVSKLLNAGADPSIIRKNGSNALMMAISKSDITSFNLLWRSLEKSGGCNINQVDKLGNSLLMVAVESGWETGIDFLISQDGININHQNLKGETALILSCMRGRLKVAEKLVQSDANPLLEDKTGATAICHAFVKGHIETAVSIVSQLKQECKDRYIERRVELLLVPSPSHHQQSSVLQNIVFRVLLEIRHNTDDGVSALCRFNIFGKLTACAEKHNRDTKLLWTLYHFCACLIHERADSSKHVSQEMAEQFLKANGPKFIIDAINSHSDDFQLKGAALLSIQATTEVSDGVRWLRSNYTTLAPYVAEFKSQMSSLNYWQEKEKAKVLAIWEKFETTFQNISQPTTNFNPNAEELRLHSRVQNEGSPSSGRKQKNKQITVKMTEKQSEQRRSQIIFDPDTKRNFGPSAQVSEGDNGKFVVVSHSRRGKPNSRPKKNRFSITMKREKTPKGKSGSQGRRNIVLESHADKRQGDDFPTICRNPSQSNSSERSEWTNSTRSYAGALSSPRSQTETIFLPKTPFRPSAHKIGNKEVRSSPRTYAGALRGKSPNEKPKKSCESIWDTADLPATSEKTQVEDNGIWEDYSETQDDDSKLSSFSDLSHNTFPLLNETSKPSCLETSRNSDLDEEGSASIQDEKDEPKERSYTPTINEENKIKLKVKKISSFWLGSNDDNDRQTYSNIIIDIITKMMRMLMKKTGEAMRFSDYEINSKSAKEKRTQNDSERWRSLIHKMAEEPARNRMKIGSAYFVDKQQFVLNKGDFHTYIGVANGNKEVVVKRSCSVDHEKLIEIGNRLRQEFICHENVLSLLEVVRPSVIGPAYMISEMCEYNMEEYLHLLKEKDLLPYIGKELVCQLLEGLSYLHERPQPILHGRLKPTNVLVNVTGRLLLSDFGLMDVLPPQCGLLEYSVAGSSKITWRSWRPKECLVALTSSIARTVYTSSSDIQVAGMLVHFILSGGMHPYGTSDMECQTNIARGIIIYHDMGREADDLITSMLSHDRISRPLASTALKHPFFWYPQRRLDFLITVASQPEMEYRSCDIVKTTIENACTETKNWLFKVHPRILQETYFNHPTEKTTSDLLRLILNCVARYNSLSIDVRETLNSPALYFAERFPTLVMTIYEILRQSHWQYRPDLSDYFS